MNKWLVGLIIAALLPLVFFIGNLKVNVPEGGAAPGQEAANSAAPELVGISGWVNSEPFNISSLRGKVVLVDFWTYTCINCIRTLPYLNSWYGKYGDKGLVIIGIHSPEFDFEKDVNNVKSAVEKYGVKYPVALDNSHSTWAAFKNNYWPHKYLIDMDGNIRYDHIGEGGYDVTEKAIQQLLMERADKMQQNVTIPTEVSSPNDTIGVNFTGIATPEIYLGYGLARTDLGNDEGFKPDKTVIYTAPSGELVPNTIYLGGSWKNNLDNLELVSGEGKILLRYTAKAVNIVAGSEKPANLSVALDGIPVNSSGNGSDVANEKVVVSGQRLYNLVTDQQGYQSRTIEITVKGAGFKIYTFTFG